MLPFFSIIIPSFNRKQEISELLYSLNSQTLSNEHFEIIVVDDGSTDGTEDWIENFQDQNVIPLKLIKQDHQGPGAARNTGMDEAEGDVFVFIDSDCIAPSNWLQTIKNTFDQDPVIEAFGGRDDAHKSFSPLLKAINYSMTSFLTTGGMRGGKKKRLAKFYPRSFNMGLRKELYKKIGGFGGLRHGQDIEFSNRIITSGAKVAYIHDAVVFHKRRTSLSKFFKQVFNWGVARINLYKIDATMLEPLHFIPALGFWFIVFFSLAAFIIPSLFNIWTLFILAGLFSIFLSAIHAAIRWKNISTGFWTPFIMIAQISGYGLGFTSAFIWRVLLRQEEFTGFVKKYYK